VDFQLVGPNVKVAVQSATVYILEVDQTTVETYTKSPIVISPARVIFSVTIRVYKNIQYEK
jgi:hypothetical protein